MAPLFLISLASIGYEIALTRYFAVAKWSEYGYWVISIVLAGFALSGVVMALGRDRFARHGTALLGGLPVLLILAAAIGYHFVTTNPFNPLQLQNAATFVPQLYNIAAYYLCLLPFFFLAGLYVGLSFVLNDHQLGRVYGFDLTGAGAGALLVLGLMALVHPFALVPCLLVPLALATPFTSGWTSRRRRGAMLLATAAALLAGEALLLADNQAQFNDFKAIYAPLHVPDSHVLARNFSPRGLYMMLDDFTERVDTDVSNDAGMLGLPGPPTSFGLYRDGNRLASLPRPGPIDVRYASATLSALPYALLAHPHVLLAGGGGGFRVAATAALGAAGIDVVEPEPMLRRALRRGLGPSPGLAGMAGLHILAESPIAAARTRGPYDLIDISGGFLDSAEANTSAFAAEAVAAYLRALTPGGIVSIPVSIREFPSYAIRMLATARRAMRLAGIAHPAEHVLAYRSAWTVRILLSNAAFTPARVAAAHSFCNARSFDISYFPGIDVAASRKDVFNDLPAVSFSQGAVVSGDGLHDAIADEALQTLLGQATSSARAFNLAPITYDRPSFYSVLRLEHLGTILRRVEILPQAEIGALVNLAVLAQAIAIALLVLAVPLVAGKALRTGGTPRAVIYFSALGLGFLFLEIFLIDRASFYLDDRTSGFALVLTGMLIFSGIGSMLSARFVARPRRGVRLAVGLIVLWGVVLALGLQPFMLATLAWPFLARAALVLLMVAPLSLALGLPFPLGLGEVGSGRFLPWAWGLNGAFSVVATPLANLMVLELGYDRVLLAALVLYVTAVITFPRSRRASL
ncbi:MAG: hypothetical protein KGQ40_00070 [Rhodospirillales bacterium]|nr:hypothetical protein [Rhodospirillales bacterium]